MMCHLFLSGQLANKRWLFKIAVAQTVCLFLNYELSNFPKTKYNIYGLYHKSMKYTLSADLLSY